MKTEILKIIQEVDENWICSEGLVTLKPKNHSNCNTGDYDSENQVLWTGHYYYLLYELGLINRKHENFEESFYNAERGRVNFVLKNLLVHEEKEVDDNTSVTKPISGLYNRHVNLREEPISWDEMVGLTICSYVFDLDIAKDIYEYGRKHFYIYNNTFDKSIRMNLRQWRDPDEVAWYKACAGLDLTGFDRFWLKLGICRGFDDSKKYLKEGQHHPYAKEDSLGNKYLDNYHQVTGKLMWFRKLSMLAEIDYDTWHTYRKRFVFKLMDLYGTKYFSKMHEIYWPVHYTKEEHPFVKLARIYDINR